MPGTPPTNSISDADAEAALIALAEPLKWRLNKCVPGNLDTGFDGAYAETETSWYAATTRSSHWHRFRLIPVYTAQHSPIHTDRTATFRLTFDNLRDAQLRCEYHHATGQWEPHPPPLPQTPAIAPLPGGVLIWQHVVRSGLCDRPALAESWPHGEGCGKPYRVGKDYPLYFYLFVLFDDPEIVFKRFGYFYRLYYMSHGTYQWDARYYLSLDDAKRACEHHYATGELNDAAKEPWETALKSFGKAFAFGLPGALCLWFAFGFTRGFHAAPRSLLIFGLLLLAKALFEVKAAFQHVRNTN